MSDEERARCYNSVEYLCRYHGHIAVMAALRTYYWSHLHRSIVIVDVDYTDGEGRQVLGLEELTQH